MPQPFDIVVVGSLVFDLVTRAARRPQGGETLIGESFATFPGGKGGNQALQAARLGARVLMVGRVGRDQFGERLIAVLERERVAVSGVGVDPQAGTSISQILVDAEGQNSIVNVPQANAAFRPAHLAGAEAALRDCAVLLLQLEVPQETSLAAARLAKAGGATVILDPAPAPATPPLELLDLCDIVTPNAVEAAALAGRPVEGPDDALLAAEAIGRGRSLTVIVTLGEQGCVAVGPGIRRHFPALPVAVVDGTAAGDAFNGALAVSLAEGVPLTEALSFATLAGAFCVTRPGAMTSLGRREELASFRLERRGG